MKSSFSDTANCVDVEALGPQAAAAFAKDDEPAAVIVRDSKDRSGPALVFTEDEWDAFIAGVKAGEFDRDRLTPGTTVTSL